MSPLYDCQEHIHSNKLKPGQLFDDNKHNAGCHEKLGLHMHSAATLFDKCALPAQQRHQARTWFIANTFVNRRVISEAAGNARCANLHDSSSYSMSRKQQQASCHAQPHRTALRPFVLTKELPPVAFFHRCFLVGSCCVVDFVLPTRPTCPRFARGYLTVRNDSLDVFFSRPCLPSRLSERSLFRIHRKARGLYALGLGGAEGESREEWLSRGIANTLDDGGTND